MLETAFTSSVCRLSGFNGARNRAAGGPILSSAAYMQSFVSNTSVEGDPQQGRRLPRIEWLRQSIEHDMRALPHLYPVPNAPFLFTTHVAHLLGITVAEVVEIPHSRLRRLTRADGEQVFVATDVMAFIRGDGVASRTATPSASALLTPEDVANELRISVHQVRNLANAGDLPFINVGNGQAKPQMRFEPESIATFKARRRVAKCPSTSAPVGKPIRMTSSVEALDTQAIRENLRNATPKR
ncbi:helix-turn-helix domain-containing protein [Shinella zoogloeoides]|uniref:helix-turn-helix domain-containing protein n=1 Tax=Shinella zoogloeoides TaxID=352475 RepID=UPI00273DF51D|nr:helix-turn-helix domain-containing protein [Shinella zoogloeoides]WLR93874.1 helix-turn-helix domain-containing protein [Shinella zoogloeoides]